MNMSLLEDIFLGDEANEAQELERVIEGDEYDERPRSRSRTPDSNSNSEKEDEAEEDKRRVDPAAKPKRVVKNPRQVLNPARLTGPRGISVIPNHFKDFKFKGKGHEKEDLDLVLKKLEHWAYRLYPKFKFEDCLKKIETLGKKQAVSVHLRKIRSDQLTTDEPIIQKDSSDDEAPTQEPDEFDKLLQQQIDLARSTPAPNSVKKGFMTPGQNFAPPKATSSPSINDEQRERMLRNRKLAEERRVARLKLTSNNSFEDGATVVNKSPNINLTENTPIIEKSQNINIDLTEENTRIGNVTGDIDLTVDTNEILVKKQNRSNVIDSSDDESDLMTVNQPITVDVHVEKEKNRKENENNDETVANGDEKDNSVEEGDIMSINQSITVDVHAATEKNGKDNEINGESVLNTDEKDNPFEESDRGSINQTNNVDIQLENDRNGKEFDINDESIVNSDDNVHKNNKIVALENTLINEMEINDRDDNMVQTDAISNNNISKNTPVEENLTSNNNTAGNTNTNSEEEMEIDFNNDF